MIRSGDGHLPPCTPKDAHDPEDWQVTGNPHSNPLGAAFVIAIVMLLIIFLCWPSKTTEPPALTATQITELRNIYKEVERLNRIITGLNQDLIFYETGGNLLKNPTVIEQYYQRLSVLQDITIGRSHLAEKYNGLVRDHFIRAKTSPLELNTINGGFLPTGIR